MKPLTRWVGFAVAVACAPTASVLSAPGSSLAGPSAAEPAHVVAMNDTFRRCDFTSAFNVAAGGPGRAFAVIHEDSPTKLSAEVHLDTGRPGTHYDVRLIQAPQPASVACTGGDPGISQAGLDTDAAGNATVTLSDTIRPGKTGAWVFMTLPGELSSVPAESYASDFILAI
jgi:hypothetical protein